MHPSRPLPYRLVMPLLASTCLCLGACDFVQSQALKTYMAFEKGLEANEGSDIVASEQQTFAITALIDDLTFPWGLDFLPDGRMLVTERPGKLRIFDTQTRASEMISGVPDVYYKGQGGLLDVVIHPRFTETGWVYLSAAVALDDKLSTTRVLRYRLRDNTLTEETIIFEAEPAGTSNNHFGSAMLFDNAGLLYITVGDRKQRERAQDLGASLGKVLRLHDDGSIPADNPFTDTAGALPAIYTYGHRNPQGITIDRATGRIWTAEHGPQGGDEINLLRPGANYGWPVITYGEEYGGGKIGVGTRRRGMEQPVHYYVPSIATGGLAYYDGAALPGWRGDLFVAGLRAFSVSRVDPDSDSQTSDERLLEGFRFRARNLQQGPDGWLYLLSENGGILQLKPVE